MFTELHNVDTTNNFRQPQPKQSNHTLLVREQHESYRLNFHIVEIVHFITEINVRLCVQAISCYAWYDLSEDGN